MSSSDSIVGLAVREEQQLLDSIAQAYQAGRLAYTLKQRGQAIERLVAYWTHPGVAQPIASAFWKGVDDA